MSTRVMSWAWDRTDEAVRSPSALLLLVLIADFAGELGDCWPSIATLAAKSKQSAQSVRRRLAELEEAGLIARISRHRDNGARTSDAIVVLFSDEAKAHADKLRAAAQNDGEICSGARDDTPPTNLEGAALSNWKGAPSNRHKAPLPTVEGAYIEPPLNLPLNLPPAPQWAREGGEGSFGEVKASSDIGPPNAWGRFEEAWDFSDGRESTTAAEREFDKLSAEDQAEAIEEAARVRGRSHNTVYACVWLRERRWKKARPGKPAARVTDKQPVWIKADSPQWAAWQAYIAETGKPKLSAKQTNRGLGWWVERAWPPGHVEAQGAADRGREAAA